MKLTKQQAASRQQFARNSSNYGAGHILADTSDIRRGLTRVRFPENARPPKALDIATGGGHTAIFLARLGFDVTASDLAPAMLRRAKAAAQAEHLKIRTRCHPAEELPYKEGTFDLVTCRVAAHHFARPAAFIREVARVLKPDGYFLLIDGTIPDDDPEAARWIHRLEKLRDPSHGRFLSPARWRELCERNGLAVKRSIVTRFKQPDIRWYFDTASTPEANRRKVLRHIDNIPPRLAHLFRLRRHGETITWWWHRLTLLARRSTS